MGRTACTEPQCLYKGALYLYLWSWKSRAIPLLPLWTVRPVQGLSACTRVHFTFTCGHERVELYLYSPYGPYGLYRASVSVQGCTLPLPFIPHIQDVRKLFSNCSLQQQLMYALMMNQAMPEIFRSSILYKKYFCELNGSCGNSMAKIVGGKTRLK